MSSEDWRCECGDLNRDHEAFCFRCGAGRDEDPMTEIDYRRLAEEEARKQGERVTARAQANYERIIAEGKAIDIAEAHARCFTGDNHGTVFVTGAL